MKDVETAHSYSQYIIKSCCAENSWSAERCQACCILSSQPPQWHSTVRPSCYIVSRKRCPLDGPTSTRGRNYFELSRRPRIPARFFLSIDPGSDCLNTACSIHIMYYVANGIRSGSCGNYSDRSCR